jgi:hypothetical protein
MDPVMAEVTIFYAKLPLSMKGAAESEPNAKTAAVLLPSTNCPGKVWQYKNNVQQKPESAMVTVNEDCASRLHVELPVEVQCLSTFDANPCVVRGLTGSHAVHWLSTRLRIGLVLGCKSLPGEGTRRLTRCPLARASGLYCECRSRIGLVL